MKNLTNPLFWAGLLIEFPFVASLIIRPLNSSSMDKLILGIFVGTLVLAFLLLYPIPRDSKISVGVLIIGLAWMLIGSIALYDFLQSKNGNPITSDYWSSSLLNSTMAPCGFFAFILSIINLKSNELPRRKRTGYQKSQTPNAFAAERRGIGPARNKKELNPNIRQ